MLRYILRTFARACIASAKRVYNIPVIARANLNELVSIDYIPKVKEVEPILSLTTNALRI